jgi:hypothetical protein
MDKDIATYAPFKIEMKVMLVGEGGEYDGYTAWADIDLPPGKIPTQEVIDNRIHEAMRQQGFRLATRHEFVGELLEERTGTGGWAVPGLDQFEFSLEQPA